MLRLREWLEFKPSDTVGKFEILVASGSDRILGEMVREKRMVERKKEEIEYYKRKKAQKEKAEAEEEAKAKGEGGETGKGEQKGEEKGEEKEEGKAKSDTSTKKVKDGKEVENAIDDKRKVGAAEGEVKEKEVEVEEGKLMVAIPIKTDGVKDLDAKHDQVAVLPAPGEAAKAAAKAEVDGGAKVDVEAGEEEGNKKEGEKEKEVRDPMRDAERIAKMMGNKGDLKMEDIQIALKVLEAASGMSSFSFHPIPVHSDASPPLSSCRKEILIDR